MSNLEFKKRNYLIFAADTETQTLWDDTAVINKYNNVDTKAKQCEIMLDRSYDEQDFQKISKYKKMKSIWEKQKDVYSGQICAIVVPYMIGYMFTGWTTSGGKQHNLRANSRITRKTTNINKHTAPEHTDDDINYFLSDNEGDSAILSMLDDIVDKYGHMINRKDGRYTAMVYFHNLKFDIRPLLYQQFKRNPENFGDIHKIIKTQSSVLSYTFMYRGCCFELRDSFQIMPESIAKLGKLVGLNKLDGADTYQYHDLTNSEEVYKELKYFKRDILILKKSLDFYFTTTKKLYLTASQMSYDLGKKAIKYKGNTQTSVFVENFGYTREYRKIVTSNSVKTHLKNKFMEKFKFFQKAYFGGFVLVNQSHIAEVLRNGITFDINSLYPYCMINRDLPNIFKVNEITSTQLQECLYTIENHRPDYCFGVVNIDITKLKLKNNGIPCIPKRLGKKVNDIFKPVNNVDDLENKNITITILDLYHIIQNYQIKYTLNDGYYWEHADMLNKPLSSYLKPLKVEKERLNSDDPKRLIVKLQMNSFYGKFGQRPRTNKDSALVSNQQHNVGDFTEVNYFESDTNMIIDDDSINARNIKNNIIAVAITAYARDVLLSTMENINNSGKAIVAYCDTDSIHVYPNDTPESQKLFSGLNFNGTEAENQQTARKIAQALNIGYDQHELGKWKDEQYMAKGVYLANKKYWEVDPVHNPQQPNIIKFAGISRDGRKRIEQQGFESFSKINKYGRYVLSNTAKALASGIRIIPVNKKIRSE